MILLLTLTTMLLAFCEWGTAVLSVVWLVLQRGCERYPARVEAVTVATAMCAAFSMVGETVRFFSGAGGWRLVVAVLFFIVTVTFARSAWEHRNDRYLSLTGDEGMER